MPACLHSDNGARYDSGMTQTADTAEFAVHAAAPNQPAAGMEGGRIACQPAAGWRHPMYVTDLPDWVTCSACLAALAAAVVHLQRTFGSTEVACLVGAGRRTPWPGRVTCPTCARWADEHPDGWPLPLPVSLRPRRLVTSTVTLRRVGPGEEGTHFAKPGLDHRCGTGACYRVARDERSITVLCIAGHLVDTYRTRTATRVNRKPTQPDLSGLSVWAPYVLSPGSTP